MGNRLKRIKCNVCEQEKTIAQFYKSKSSLSEYFHVCKQCIQEKIDYNNMSTIFNMLKEMNIVFVPDIWDKVVRSDTINPFGKYLSKIKNLNQYKYKTWSDSIFDKEHENEEEMVYSPEWVGYFTKRDLKYLNSYIKDMNRDYNITTRNHVDYAKKIAKLSLAVDKSYNDVLTGKGSEQTYKQLVSMFDSLCKSAQFSESTRTANDISLSSFGETFDRVEKNRYIYKHKPASKDIYDKLIEQFSNIEKSL